MDGINLKFFKDGINVKIKIYFSLTLMLKAIYYKVYFKMM